METESLELKIISEIVNEEVYHIELGQIESFPGFIAFGRTRLFFLEKRVINTIKYEYIFNVITGVNVSPDPKMIVEIHFSRDRKVGNPRSWVVYVPQKLRFVEALKAQYKTFHLVEKRILVELPLYVNEFKNVESLKINSDSICVPSPKIANVLLSEEPFVSITYRGYDFIKWKHVNISLNETQGNLFRTESTEKGEYTLMELQVSDKYSLVEKAALKDYLNLEFVALEFLQSATSPTRNKPIFILKSEKYLRKLNHSSEGDKSIWDAWFVRSMFNDRFWNILVLRRKYIPPDLNHWQDIILNVVSDDPKIDEWAVKNMGDMIMPAETRETSYQDVLEKYIDALRCDEEDLSYYSQVMDINPTFQNSRNPFIEKTS